MKKIVNRTAKIVNRKSPSGNVLAFTLVELLTVIAIIGVIAGFIFPVMKMAKAHQYKTVARGELELIQTALENYKSKYGAYPPGNQKPVNFYLAPVANSMMSQLYYELAGTTAKAVGGVPCFVTLDGSQTIKVSDVPIAYGVGGFVNCTKGGGEDGISAQNFVSGLGSKEINNSVSNGVVANTTVLVTSVGGPDDSYRPLGVSGLNPIRYVYPGVNNPNSYDLWVQIVISRQTNLVCNWSRQVILNSPLP